MQYKRNFEGTGYYKDNTAFGKFLLYKIFYPIVNNTGLNRAFNLLRHKLGRYNQFPDTRCQWCGKKHK